MTDSWRSVVLTSTLLFFQAIAIFEAVLDELPPNTQIDDVCPVATLLTDFADSKVWLEAPEAKSTSSRQIFARSHPPALERRQSVLQKVPLGPNFNAASCERSLRMTEICIESLKEHVQRSPRDFTFYGSVYLAAPNTPWRGPALVDREDY